MKIKTKSNQFYVRLFISVDKPDAMTNIATQILFAFHMLFVNILLVNLLIGLFRYLNSEKSNQNIHTELFLVSL